MVSPERGVRMLSGPTYSIGLQWIDEHWQITIKELDICAVALHAKTFDEASRVADHMLVAALLPREREQARKRAMSAA